MNEVRSSAWWRFLCLIGIHQWSVPKSYKKMKDLYVDGSVARQYEVLLQGCTVTGCCKLKRFEVEW